MSSPRTSYGEPKARDFGARFVTVWNASVPSCSLPLQTRPGVVVVPSRVVGLRSSSQVSS